MSAASEDTMTPDQVTVKSLRELTASIQNLCDTITSDYHNNHPDNSRGRPKIKDTISATLHEEMTKGPPQQIMDWEKIEPMATDEIEMKNKLYTQKYEEFWNKFDKSTQSEEENASKAYTSAFNRLDDIYRLIGWRDKDSEYVIFDKYILTESRDLLIESIFGIEAYQMSHSGEFSEISRMVFELSRLPRLLIILVRVACRQVHIVRGSRKDKTIKERPFDTLTVVRTLALIARVPKDHNSMEKLLHQCYAHRVLNQPDVSDVDTYHRQFDLIYDCLTALDFTRRFREFREPLCSLFYMRYKSESVHMFFEHVKTHEAAMIGIDPYPELPLKENTNSMFHPDTFAVSYLQAFGRLNIEWTDCLDEHLKIYANRNCIRVFAHPTFFYNGIDLHRGKRDYTEPTYFELSLTYALLFRPISSSNLRRLENYVNAGKYLQLPWNKCVTFGSDPIHRLLRRDKEEAGLNFKKLDIDPVQSPTKDILSESFYRCSVPPSIQVAFNLANPSETVKGITDQCDQHKVTKTSMHQISELAPNYPEDLKFMIISVMESNFADVESFVRFPYFAPRLRRLQAYLDSRQPRTIRELWYDRRDYRSWYVFWGACLFCVFASLFIILVPFVKLASLS